MNKASASISEVWRIGRDENKGYFHQASIFLSCFKFCCARVAFFLGGGGGHAFQRGN